MVPKNWEELLIWLAMQFPMMGAAAIVVWWVLRWTGKRHADEIARNDQLFARILQEKDIRMSEKETRIAELKNEVAELKSKLSRSPAKDKPTEGGAKQ